MTFTFYVNYVRLFFANCNCKLRFGFHEILVVIMLKSPLQKHPVVIYRLWFDRPAREPADLNFDLITRPPHRFFEYRIRDSLRNFPN